MNSLTKLALLVFLVAGVCISNAPAGSVITYEYDKYGNCTAVSTASSAANSTPLEKSTYAYDGYRRCTSMVESAHTSQSRTWTWSYDRYFGTQPYDQSAHTSKQWRLQIEPAFDAASNRNVTARWFDANDRIIDEYTGVIQGPGGMFNGPDIEVHHFGYDENGQKNDYIDPRGRETTYTYDNRNRLFQTTEPLNRITQTFYDMAGNKTDVIFPDTKSQHWQDYDAFGQARTFIDERTNRTDLIYCWGPMKKLYKVTTHRDKDGGGTEDQPTTFTYDGLGIAMQVEFPDHSTEVSSYEFGQLKTFKTRKDQLKTISYDARGRETSNIFANNAAPGISRSWDDANRAVRLCNIYSTINFEYDGAGLVSKEVNTVTGRSPVETTYKRYPSGGVSEIKYPYGRWFRRDYNSRGQLAATGDSDGNGNWISQFVNYHYLADGKMNWQDYGNGVQTTFDYDGRGMTKTVDHHHWAPYLNYSKREYTRDLRDRIIAYRKGTDGSVNHMENGHGDRFRYDDEGQLVEAWYGASDPVNSGAGNWRYDGFNYDALGNRAGANFLANHGPMTFTRKDNGLNQYRGWWNFSITNYDDDIGAPSHANGVLMQEGNITAGYNALNQPMMIYSAATSPNWMFFGYDPLGRCVKRWVEPLSVSGGVPAPESNPASAVYLYYDGWNLIQETPFSGGVIWNGSSLVSASQGANKVYVHGARMDEIVVSENFATGQYGYHHYDANGNCTLLTGFNGEILEQYEYNAFGEPYFFNAGGSEFSSSQWNNRFLFTGREYLSELKLYDYRARLYQPELGRFMQPDPKEFGAGDYNLYRYCHNDPVNKTDPTGLDTLDIYIWNAELSSRSIGHVYIADRNLSLPSVNGRNPGVSSPFPAPRQSHADHVQRDLASATSEEGRKADRHFVVQTDPRRDGEVRATLADHASRPYWDLFATRSNETNCAVAGRAVLSAAGYRDIQGMGATPGDLGSSLDRAAAQGSVRSIIWVTPTGSYIPRPKIISTKVSSE